MKPEEKARRSMSLVQKIRRENEIANNYLDIADDIILNKTGARYGEFIRVSALANLHMACSNYAYAESLRMRGHIERADWWENQSKSNFKRYKDNMKARDWYANHTDLSEEIADGIKHYMLEETA